jgi:hypothetical protein
VPGDDDSHGHWLAAVLQQYQVVSVQVLDLSSITPDAGKNVQAGLQDEQQQQEQEQQQEPPQLDAFAAELLSRPTSPGHQQPSAGPDNSSSNSTSSNGGQLTTVTHSAGKLTPALAPPATSSSRGLSAADESLMGAGSRDLVSAVIPLPYAHYRLVREDGRALERPDKHPFALSRVLYDAR